MESTDINKLVPPGLKCSNCGKQFGKTYGWLRTHDRFVCVCGERTEWEPDAFVNLLDDISKERANINKEVKRIIKRIKR